MFEAAQEIVGVGEFPAGFLGQQLARREQRGSTFSVGRACSAVSRPPRMSWKTWAMNSISRMPPGPLDVVGHVQRHFAPDLCVQVAHRVDGAEIEVLAVDEGQRLSFSAFAQSGCRLSPAFITRALIHA